MQPHIPGSVFSLIALLLGLGAASLAAIVFLPQATVTLSPALLQKTVEQDITLLTGTTEPDFRRFILPAKVVEARTTEELVVKRDAENITDDFAQGTVRFINQQLDEQRLLPKTHLRHEKTGVMFLTDTAVTIPPQGEIEISVTAKEPGPSGEVAAGKLIVDKLSPELQQVIYAESDSSFSGGQVTESSLTQAEIDAVKEKVRQQAEDRLRGELTGQAGGRLIREELISFRVEEEQISTEAGSKAASFTVRTTLEARAFVVDENDLLSLTLLQLRSREENNAEFTEYDPESFTAKIIQANFDQGEARITGQLTGSFSQNIERSLFDTTALAGLTESEVKDYFTEFDSVGEVEIELSPFWVSRVPARKSAVSVVIK